MIAVLLIKHKGEDRLLDKCLASLEQQTNKEFKVYETDPESINQTIQFILDEGLKYICYLDSYDYYLSNHIDIIYKAIEATKTKYIYTISKVVRYKDCGGTCCIENEVPKITEKMYDERTVNINNIIRSAICMNYNYEESNIATQVNIITITHRLSD
jgi:hypothetical protein